MNSIINYNMPLFRPPSEAYSLILQVTLGCSWNKCSFCEMYTSKQFTVRKQEDIVSELLNYSKYDKDIRKIFLADGNVLVLSTKRLLSLLTEIKKIYPRLQRISAYALPSDLKDKSIDELKELREAGLKLIYVGIETGDDELLGLIDKSETAKSTVENLVKARQAGIETSVMIINGLGGLNYTRNHALNSAKVINYIQPEFLSTLVLSFPFGIEHFRKRFHGIYEPMTIIDLMKEQKMFIENLELKATIFRCDHASNYLILKGILSRDKQKLTDKLNASIASPEAANFRQEWQRGL